MTFWKTVRAYLTGWLIVQPIYNRVFNAWKRMEMARPDGMYRQSLRDQAVEIVDEIDRRRQDGRFSQTELREAIARGIMAERDEAARRTGEPDLPSIGAIVSRVTERMMQK